ncbi:MAG TPA: hypothetical protein VHD61_15290 [Lacunisphaera sp.]|nr:hypothetical protein [Lacunisphaera sp.]
MDHRPAAALSQPLHAAAEFRLRELTGAGGLRAQLLPSGAVHAFRLGRTLLNQFLPGPAEDGLLRLLVRWLGPDGAPQGWASLVGAEAAFACAGPAATWRITTAAGLACTTTLALHPAATGWAWRIRLRNTGATVRRADLLLAQDLGLGDEAAVRNNEAYTSQYIDLLPVDDATLGPVVLARQNQPMAAGARPWLACACAPGAAAFCTDGWQFFGADHRLTGEPAAARLAALPSQRLQYESALAGLQSRAVAIAPGATVELFFLTACAADHPDASSPADLAAVRALLPANWMPDDVPAPAAPPGLRSVFTGGRWLHGAVPSAADWAAWFPGPRRHEETDASGRLLSFFHGADTHVVARDKEASVARPHGHILRSGDARWIDDRQFGLTCYAAGIFGAQAYLGNCSVARLLSVVRNHLNVARASGQRVFIRASGAWCQLGVPSAFALDPGLVRWIYRLADRVIEARAWCSRHEPASFLDLRVTEGPPTEFLLTHQLALGGQEFEHGGDMEVHAEGWIGLRPAADSFLARHLPGTCFALAAADPGGLAALGGDELIHADGTARLGPYAAAQTVAVDRFGFLMLGSPAGPGALEAAVARCRREYDEAAAPARPPAAPLRLHHPADPGVARVDEILPWFTHNAAIHFSSPHGLEQYGGAAWGVRDVCQGSVEWLLAAGDFATVRRILGAVFGQQYTPAAREASVAGCWPQWFMFPPFRFIQQAHSHGDVCFWPVKALCDYVEASNDFDFLRTLVGYTDPSAFEAAGPVEPLWAHCDRVIDVCEARFLPGTALVNYGDGDWDDTLQPADPAMRTRMVSTWTVALAYQTLRQFAAICRRAGESARTARADGLLARMRGDFARLALVDGTVAGFLVHELGDSFRPLLHPADRVTGIRHRLLPMTRAMLAELFTPDEARRHAGVIAAALTFPDGVRLMSEPAAYHGGLEKLFKRADTAANVGREIGLQYVHAHLRYAEAMAKLGDADRLWHALQVANPVGLAAVVPNAAARQANVYFSSSDADFADRLQAAAGWGALRAGDVPVRGGWRLYSSGPGLFLHKVRSCLLGVRESFGDVVIDPVLPRALDGLEASTHLLGRPVSWRYSVRHGTSSPRAIVVNGTPLARPSAEENPYRPGGWRVAGSELASLLRPADNLIAIEL